MIDKGGKRVAVGIGFPECDAISYQNKYVNDSIDSKWETRTPNTFDSDASAVNAGTNASKNKSVAVK